MSPTKICLNLITIKICKQQSRYIAQGKEKLNNNTTAQQDSQLNRPAQEDGVAERLSRTAKQDDMQDGDSGWSGRTARQNGQEGRLRGFANLRSS